MAALKQTDEAAASGRVIDVQNGHRSRRQDDPVIITVVVAEQGVVSTLPWPSQRNAVFRVYSDIGRNGVRTEGKTNRPPDIKALAAFKIAMAYIDNGATCSRAVFMRLLGMRHAAP